MPFGFADDTLAERLKRRPAKPMGSPPMGSNPTDVVFFWKYCPSLADGVLRNIEHRSCRSTQHPATPPQHGFVMAALCFCFLSARPGVSPDEASMLTGHGRTQNHQGACTSSVAASYKAPMLVTRVRLPACAYFSCARNFSMMQNRSHLRNQIHGLAGFVTNHENQFSGGRKRPP